MSDREKYRRAKEIFEAALSLGESEREEFAAKECAGDAALLAEVRKLLEADRQIDDAWEQAVDGEIVQQFLARPYDEALYLVGQKLNDRYLVLSKLGGGGFGVAYLASDQQLHSKPVVIKILLAKKEQSQWASKKFYQEIAALSRMNHPGAVGIFDKGVTADGNPFFVMEYVEGEPLRSAMTEEGMPFERAANIIRQLGRILDAAHEKGIYHRDLKPENIMLHSPGEDEQVKVIDFGIATVKNSLDDETNITAVAGTISYMAPEQIQGRPTASSDIYALATIAYEMLTGRLPFEIASTLNDYAAIYQLSERQQEGVKIKPTALRPDLPVAAQEEILKALLYNPKDRHKRAREFGDGLADALTNSDQKRQAIHVKTESELSTNEETPTDKFDLRTYNYKSQFPSQSANPNKLLLSAAVVIFAFAAIYGGLRLSRKVAEPERALSYWGELRQYRDDKLYGVPIRLMGGVTGETYFNSGDGLKFFVTPYDDGYLYLINEASSPDGARSSYTILFPSIEANNGSSKVIRDREIETSECIFDANAGAEKVWIIWSVSQVAELEEAVRQWSNTKDGGEIKDAGQAEFLSAFIGKYSGAKLTAEIDDANERMRLRGYGDVLVYALKLNHR